MMNTTIDNTKNEIMNLLKSDCTMCNGLCCKVLVCFKNDGFPEDKDGGVPCRFLTESNRCIVHKQLQEKALFGCMRYDCAGAGQHITTLAQGELIEQTDFTKMNHMHHILQYLLEIYTYTKDASIKFRCDALYQEWRQHTQTLSSFQTFSIDAYHSQMNELLHIVIEDIKKNYPKENQITYKDLIGKDLTKQKVQGMDLSMRYMMACNLSHTNLENTIFLGSDVRDVNICGSDLRKAHFLTQMQLNSMLGDATTRIPEHLESVAHWKK